MITKAVILAAGRGTRMRALTSVRPKPMLEIQGKPILQHLVDQLRSAGIDDILIVTGYCADQIEGHFAAEAGVRFERQEIQNGTGRAAMLAREFAGGQSFLLTYGDILASARTYTEMAAALEGAEAVLAVKSVDDPYQGAAVYVEGGRVTRIIEKPPPGSSSTHWNSAGIYCFLPSVFDHLARIPLSPRGEYELTDAIVAMLASGALVRHYAIAGWWRDIGRPHDLEEAQRVLEEGTV